MFNYIRLVLTMFEFGELTEKELANCLSYNPGH